MHAVAVSTWWHLSRLCRSCVPSSYLLHVQTSTGKWWTRERATDTLCGVCVTVQLWSTWGTLLMNLWFAVRMYIHPTYCGEDGWIPKSSGSTYYIKYYILITLRQPGLFICPLGAFVPQPSTPLGRCSATTEGLSEVGSSVHASEAMLLVEGCTGKAASEAMLLVEGCTGKTASEAMLLVEGCTGKAERQCESQSYNALNQPQ